MPPTRITIETPGGATADLSHQLRGTTTGVAAGQTVLIYDNGGSDPIGAAIVAPNGRWSTEIVLAASDNALTARVEQPGGPLVSASVHLTFEPILSPPSQGAGVDGPRSTGRIVPGDSGACIQGRPVRETFVFSDHPGQVRVFDFAVTGHDHDVARLPASEFASLAGALHELHDGPSGAVLPLDGGAITFVGVQACALKSHPADFRLHA